MSIRPTLSASIDSFNKFEQSSTPVTSTVSTNDDEIDAVAVAKGSVVLFLAVGFAPIVFQVSDVIDTIHI